MKEVGNIGKYIIYKLDKNIAIKYSKQIADLANTIPLVEYKYPDILADYKKDRIFWGKWEHSLIVFDKDNPISIIISYERQSEPNNLYPKNTLYISELAVKEQYRNKGVAKQLLENWFRINVNLYYLEGNINYTVQTNSADWNQYVIDLYKYFGFKFIGLKDYLDRTDVVLRIESNSNSQNNSLQSDHTNPHKFYIELENTSKEEFDKLLSQSWQAVGVALPISTPNPREFYSTVNSPNRERDRSRIQKQHNLTEKGSQNYIFYDYNGQVLATGYERIVYGDHSPYIEFTLDQINWDNFVHHKIKGPASYYHEHYNQDKTVMLYHQFKTVENLANPPEGKYAVNNNRTEGYADYRIGRLYLDPDNIIVKKV